MSLEEVVKTLGLPGLLICVWYLLEIQKGRRAEKADDAKNKLEDKKIDALTVGFQALAAKIDDHQRDEFEHHAKTREAIAGLAGVLNDIQMTSEGLRQELHHIRTARERGERSTELARLAALEPPALKEP